MFTTLDITKFGLYKNFTWPGNLKPFSRVNILYGRNYSGKTTLSRVFDCVAQGELHKDYKDAKFGLTDDREHTVTNRKLGTDHKVRVYNSDFVNRNLGWMNNEENGEIRPFALLGGDNVILQEEIDEINRQLGDVDAKTGLMYEHSVKHDDFQAKQMSLFTAKQALEAKMKDKANRSIKADPHLVKQGVNYNITNLKADIDAIDFRTYKPLEAEEKEVLTQTIEEAQKPLVNTIRKDEPEWDFLVREVTDYVKIPIVLTQTLSDLVADDLLQAWVDEGRRVNQGRATCAFCGNPISNERWEALNAHFSHESEMMHSKLLQEKDRIDGYEAEVEGYIVSKGLVRDNIYAEHTAQYDMLMDQWDNYVLECKAMLGGLKSLVQERLDNIFKPVLHPVEIKIPGNYTQLAQAINSLVEKNNDYGQQLEAKKEEARLKLRLDVVYQFCKDIDYQKLMSQYDKVGKEMKALEEEMSKLSAKITKLYDERKQKEQAKKDEGLAAQKITRLLVNHFGQGGLTLEAEYIPEMPDIMHQDVFPARTRFVVKRGGEYGSNLSEGEKSLISFCYFIAKMEDELKGDEAEKLVIFIDDPMSSLDSNHIFFMFSLIDEVIAEPQRYGQLFVSTHNLEFLKYLKRMAVPREEGTGKTLVSYYMVNKLRRGDSDDYRCELEEMPRYLKDYVTEYNFLFEQVYTMAKPVRGDKQRLYENEYTLYYNIGNNMRRFLECYLFYKYPSSDRPLCYLNRMFGEGHIPIEVNRIVNEFSHSTAERGMSVLDVPEVETAAKQIIAALKEKDMEHYKSLCDSIGVDNYD